MLPHRLNVGVVFVLGIVGARRHQIEWPISPLVAKPRLKKTIPRLKRRRVVGNLKEGGVIEDDESKFVVIAHDPINFSKFGVSPTVVVDRIGAALILVSLRRRLRRIESA